MLRSIVRGKRLLIAAVAIAASVATMPVPVAAAGDCRNYNTIKCNKFWPNKYGQYATLEECIETETALGNCPPGSGGGGSGEPSSFASFVKQE